MKRVFNSGLFLLFMAAIMVLPAQAMSNSYQEYEVVYTESGNIEIETTTIIYASAFRSSSRKADIVSSVKQNGAVIAEVTLSATFGYDGKTAWVSSASSSHTTYSGWSYGSERITKSGGTASLTGTLSHLLHRNISVNISLTCSPTGQIS